MTKTPVIGITVSLDHGKLIRQGQDYLYVRRSYGQAVRRAGGQPVLLSPEIAPQAVAEICDAVVISGGDDIPPTWYGEAPSPQTRLESAERLDWDRRLLDVFEKMKKPLLGVCYGMQLMNVHFGGSLHQDIQAFDAAALAHGGGGTVTHHEILLSADARDDVREDATLVAALGSRATVASMHHQAVNRVAPGFRVVATAPDGIIEAIAWQNFLGVEWHPEADETGDAIYALLVERARG